MVVVEMFHVVVVLHLVVVALIPNPKSYHHERKVPSYKEVGREQVE
jgi:hypothetical protein